MRFSESRTGLAGSLSLVLALVVMAMPLSTAAADTPLVTPHGVGALRLEATIKSLHRQGLIGGLRKGCELDRGQRAAPLRAPLKGWALFSNGTRLTSFSIEAGAETGRHIGIGSTVGEARAAYPTAEWSSPQQMYPLPVGMLAIVRHERFKLSFVFDPNTYRVTSITVPSPNFCE